MRAFASRQGGGERRKGGTSAYEFIKGAIDEGTAGSHGMEQCLIVTSDDNDDVVSANEKSEERMER